MEAVGIEPNMTGPVFGEDPIQVEGRRSEAGGVARAGHRHARGVGGIASPGDEAAFSPRAMQRAVGEGGYVRERAIVSQAGGGSLVDVA